MGFQNNQDAHRQPGLLGPQSWYLREPALEAIRYPTPISRQGNVHPSSGRQASPLLSSLEGLYGPQPSVS